MLGDAGEAGGSDIFRYEATVGVSITDSSCHSCGRHRWLLALWCVSSSTLLVSLIVSALKLLCDRLADGMSLFADTFVVVGAVVAVSEDFCNSATIAAELA